MKRLTHQVLIIVLSVVVRGGCYEREIEVFTYFVPSHNLYNFGSRNCREESESPKEESPS